ncbi:sugar transferase [Paenibacillus sp. NPDC058071]|uniref:sugar transferase n=1 Tax=Paenibacillus sp. NPDC058071 TaxID=3346326 RepID=UPI0036D81F30
MAQPQTTSRKHGDIDSLFEPAGLYTGYEKNRVRTFSAYAFLKRTFDVLGAAIGIVALSPVFLLVSVCVKIEDPAGSVFFYQRRVGKNGKPFNMYKFRSMVTNAEQLLDGLLERNEVAGAMFKMKEDPRITKVGKWIRRTSIDELPQLWNVLRGDMSLVGPRPALPREVEAYTAYDRLRLRAVPGCTGLWQVSGRNRLSFDEMVKLDLVYMEQKSMLLDIKIVLRTVKVMFASQDGC